MRWAWVFAFFLITATASVANPPGRDESVHELVMNYIHLPCEALEYSYRWMYRDITIITNAYKSCIDKQNSTIDPTMVNDKWFGLQCVFIHHHWTWRYGHIMSVERAWRIMCDDHGRIEEQYKIDF